MKDIIDKYYYPGKGDFFNAAAVNEANAIYELPIKPAPLPVVQEPASCGVGYIIDPITGLCKLDASSRENTGTSGTTTTRDSVIVSEPVDLGLGDRLGNDNIVDSANRTSEVVPVVEDLGLGDRLGNDNIVDTSNRTSQVVEPVGDLGLGDRTQVIVIDQSSEFPSYPETTETTDETSDVNDILGVGGLSGGGGGDIMSSESTEPGTVKIPKGITITGWVYPYPFIGMTLAGGGIGYFVARKFKQPLVGMLALIAAGLMAASAIGMKTFPPVKKIT